MIKDLIAKSFRKKTVEELQAAPSEHEGPQLKRVLGTWDVFILCVGCIIGAGIFALAGTAAADHAGPGIIVSFSLAAVLCAAVALCYAELASMIHVSGASYTYTYASIGEWVAFIIGWDLLLEFSVGSSAVAVGWSGYCQAILKGLGVNLPDALTTAPEHVPWGLITLAMVLVGYGAAVLYSFKNRTTLWTASAWISLLIGAVVSVMAVGQIHSINLLAILIVLTINALLVVGVKLAARATFVLVILQTVVILFFIAIGAWYVDPANFSPFMPMGWMGVFTGTAIVFFAYIGFETGVTVAEECKEPQRNLPTGLIWSLVVCTVLYMLMATVMVGALEYTKLGTDAPVATVLEAIGHKWAVPIISIGALAGLTSTLLTLLMGQSRVLMRMSKDGLLPKKLGDISPRFNTPVVAIVVLGGLVAVTAGLLPINELAELCNIGTLFAFMLVAIAVVYLRLKEPTRVRSFRCPHLWLMSGIGVVGCVVLMLSLPSITWIRFGTWLAIGVVIYFAYGIRHSNMNSPRIGQGK